MKRYYVRLLVCIMCISGVFPFFNGGRMMAQKGVEDSLCQVNSCDTKMYRYNDGKESAFQDESISLLSCSVLLTLPTPYKIQKENLEEGVFYYILLVDETLPRDSSYILVADVSMTRFPMDTWEPDSVTQKEDCVVKMGQHNGKYWRKDKRDRINIYYDKVSPENRDKYNRILDELSVKKR